MLVSFQLIFRAWKQRRTAHAITTEMHKLPSFSPTLPKNATQPLSGDLELGTGEGEGQLPQTQDAPVRKYPWTHVHSHLAVMGGFAFDTSKHPVIERLLHKGHKRATLSQLLLVDLANYMPSLIPDISEAVIKDKSKASKITKTLVCMQATWFCAQCIDRLAAGLLVSLLELNTFGHCLCALLTYFLWWDKPMDIEEPFLLLHESVHQWTTTSSFSKVVHLCMARPSA